MSCPNISNKEVVQQFNEIVESLGGRPLTAEEFKDVDLRNLRRGLDYAAMEAAYKIWDGNNGNEIDKAPNGQPSHLFLELLNNYNGDRQKAIVAKSNLFSLSFRTWFGDWLGEDKTNVSKVVDENGEPLIVYHGTNAEFSVFDFKKLGEVTSLGSYTDIITGEQIPVDSSSAFFFTNNINSAYNYRNLGIWNNINEHRMFYKNIKAILLNNNFMFTALDSIMKKRQAEFIDNVLSPILGYDLRNALNKKLLSELQKLYLLTKINTVLLKIDTSDDARSISNLRNSLTNYELLLSILKNNREKLLSGEKINEYDFDNYEMHFVSGYGNRERGDIYTIIRFNKEDNSYEVIIDNKGLQKITSDNIDIFFLLALKAISQNKEQLINSEKKAGYNKGKILKVFLNIRNPLSHDYNNSPFPDNYLVDAKKGEEDAANYGFENTLKRPLKVKGIKIPTAYIAARLVRKAKKDGNDGVIYENVVDPFIMNSYGIFSPNQAKSIDNNGEYSRTNDNMSYFSSDDVKEIKGSLGVDKNKLINLLGAKMYKSNIQLTVEKETIQNAFDAVKIAKYKGLIKKGKIIVSRNRDTRTISVEDNGIGMTPEIVLKAFFTIGGSDKGNVDNSIKSGGLGLAKMAFLFSAETIKVETIRDGILTTVSTNPEEIKNDNFIIRTERTNRPNGTKITVKIPKSYKDENNNERSIYFDTWEKGFLDKPLIGDTDIVLIDNGKEKYNIDANKVPSGYVSIGSAHSAFGDLDIYINPNKKSKYGESSKILISGLYQFDHNAGDYLDPILYPIIINIKPSVDTTSNIYPINNTREGFNVSVNGEVSDLDMFIKIINKKLLLIDIAKTFESAFSMDPSVHNNYSNTESKEDYTERVQKVLKSIAEENKNNSNVKEVKSNDGFTKLVLNILKNSEEGIGGDKSRTSTLVTPKVELYGKNGSVDTSKFNINKPIFHNNTTFTPDKKTIEFLKNLGELMIEVRTMYMNFYKNNPEFTEVMSRVENQFWGVSFDKNYGGVNVNPKLFNFLAINPFYHINDWIENLSKGNLSFALTDYILHLINHEFNHNYESGEDARFTGRFALTYAEFAAIPSYFIWKRKLLQLLENNIELIIENSNKYENANNIGDSLEGGRITTTGTENKNNQDLNNDNEKNVRSIQNQNDYGDVSEIRGRIAELSRKTRESEIKNETDNNTTTRNNIDVESLKKDLYDRIGPFDSIDTIKKKVLLFDKEHNANFYFGIGEHGVYITNGKFANSSTDAIKKDVKLANKDFIQNVIFKKLSKLFPNLRLPIFLSDEDYEEACVECGANRYSNSFIYKNQVVYKESALTTEIAIEELLHPFVYTLKIENPRLFNRLVDEAKKEFVKLSREIDSAYSENKDEELVTLVLSRFLKREYEITDYKSHSIFKLVLNCINWFINKLILAIGVHNLTIMKYRFNISKLSEVTNFLDLAEILNSNDIYIPTYGEKGFVRNNISIDSLTLTLLDSDKESLRKVTVDVKDRLKAENINKRQNNTKILLFSNLVADIESSYDEFTSGIDDKSIPKADTIDLLISTLHNKNGDGLLDICNTELELIERVLNGGTTKLTPEYLITMSHDILGFYKHSLSDLATILNSTNPNLVGKSYLNESIKNKNEEELFNLYTQLVNKVLTLLNSLDTKIEEVCTDFVNTWVDNNVYVGDTDAIKKNMIHWLHNEINWGTIGTGELFMGNAATSNSLIIRMCYLVARGLSLKSNGENIDKGSELLEAMKNAESIRDKLSPTNFLLQFCEKDSHGKTTGFFIREKNYGLYYADLFEYKEILRSNDKYKDHVKVVHDEWTNSDKYQFDDEDIENQFYDDIDDWIGTHAHRRYLPEYYKKRRRILSKSTRNKLDRIQRLIDKILSLCTDKETGTVYRFKLTTELKSLLKRFEKDKRRLANFYIEQTAIDEHGKEYVSAILAKTGIDLEIALEIYNWHLYLSKNIKHKSNVEKYNRDLSKVEAEFGKGSKEVNDFINDNCHKYISEDFWSLFATAVPHRPMTEEQEAKINKIKYKYNLITLRVKKPGFNYPDLLSLSSAEWAELKKLDLELEDAMAEVIESTGTWKTGFSSIAAMNPVKDVVTGKSVYKILHDKYGEELFIKLFTYVSSNGTIKPLRVFLMLSPIKQKDISVLESRPDGLYDEINPVLSSLADPKFDPNDNSSTQPISMYDNKEFEKVGLKEFNADGSKNKYFNKKKRILYDKMLSTMWEANAKYGMSTGRLSYRLPLLHGEASSMVLNRGFGIGSLVKSMIYGYDQSINVNEQDTLFSEKTRLADGVARGLLNKRFIRPLDDPEHVSTDLIHSITKYYEAASTYNNKSDDYSILELLYDVAKKTGDTDNVRRLRNLLDTEVYDIHSTATKKKTRKLSKIGKLFAYITTCSMLSHNHLSFTKGYIDAFRTAWNEAALGKYMNRDALFKADLEILKEGFKNIDAGSKRNYTKTNAAMAYNNLGGNIQDMFKYTSNTYLLRFLKKHAIMGEFTAIDHNVTKHLMLSQYDRYRLITIPNSTDADGNVKRVFLNKEEVISVFKKNGLSRKDAITAYKQATTLWDAYELSNHQFKLKDEFKPYVTKDLEIKVLSGIKALAAHINGVLPEGAASADLNRRTWFSAIITNRGFLLDQFNERLKQANDFGTYIPDDVLGYKLKEDPDKEDGLYNAELGTIDRGLYRDILSSCSKVYLKCLIAWIKLFGNDTKRESIDLRRSKAKLTESEKYSIAKTIMEISEIAMFTALTYVIVPLAFDRYIDDDFKNWVFKRLALLSVAMVNESSTYYWPGTPLDILNTPSTWYTTARKNSYTLNLLYYGIKMISTLSAEDDDASDTHHSWGDVIKRGSYKGSTYGKRALYKALSAVGLPFDNIYRSFSINSTSATFEYYNRKLAPANLITKRPESGYFDSTKHKKKSNMNFLSPGNSNPNFL